MRLKERTFFYKELKFHINDAKYNNEFTPKYLLMFWNDSFGYWQEQLHVGSKKEAQHISKNVKNHIAECLLNCSLKKDML